MVTFPTLSRSPYVWDESWVDNTIRSEKEGGYVSTRARHTRVLKTVSVKWRGLTLADKALIDTFVEDTAVGAESFQLTAADDVVWTIKMTSAPKLAPMEASASALWHFEMECQTV